MVKNYRYLLLVALALLLIVSACKGGSEEVSEYPVIGSDPLDVHVYETQEEAMRGWKGDGFNDDVVVRASSWSDIDALVKAHDEGLVSEVYWLIPIDIYKNITNAEQIIRTYLEIAKAGFPEDDLFDMKMNEGCLSGKVRGLEMHVCNYSNLPFVKDPVVLSIDACFFPDMADMRNINKLGAVKLLMDSLKLKGLRVKRAEVYMGIQDGHMRPIHRYLGEVTAEMLRKPEMINAKEPPKIWAIKDRAENLMVAGLDEDFRKFMDEEVPRDDADDPNLRLIDAAMLARQGKFGAALAEGEAVCRDDKEYCLGLQYLGYLAGLAGNEQWKERFDNKATELVPKGITIPEKLMYASPHPGQQ